MTIAIHTRDNKIVRRMIEDETIIISHAFVDGAWREWGERIPEGGIGHLVIIIEEMDAYEAFDELTYREQPYEVTAVGDYTMHVTVPWPALEDRRTWRDDKTAGFPIDEED